MCFLRRKSDMKKKRIIYIVLAIAAVMFVFLCNHLHPENRGIIGQADGPTAIFISN